MILPRVLPRFAALASLFSATLVLLVGVGCDNGSVFRPSPSGPKPLPPGTPGTWQDLELSNGFVEVQALASWNGNLIAGGSFFDVGGSPSTSLASWDGTSWTRMGPNFGGNVRGITTYNGHLVVCGSFPHINGDTVRYVGEWDGVQWTPLGSGPNRSATALAVYNGDLIMGGLFESAGGVPASNIARWDGTSWHPLGEGLNSSVSTLTVFQGRLVAGGYFYRADGALAPGIAAWDGFAWSSLGAGVGGAVFGNPFGTVHALAVHGDSLIVGGDFTSAGGVPAYHVAKWDGAQWDSLASGVGQFSYENVRALAEYADTLVVGGSFPGNVRRWTGSAWVPMDSLTGGVDALTVHDGWLIAGGFFPREPGQNANGIARWVK